MLKLSDLHLQNLNGVNKIGMNGKPSETFYVLGFNTVLITFDEDTDEVLKIRVNSQEIDCQNSDAAFMEKVVDELNFFFDSIRHRRF